MAGSRKAAMCFADAAMDAKLASGAIASKLWIPRPTDDSSNWTSMRSKSGPCAKNISSV